VIILTTHLKMFPIEADDSDIKKFCSENFLNDFVSWVIKNREDNQIIGYIGYQNISDEKEAKVRYCFSKESYVGSMAVEAIKCFTKHLFFIRKKELSFIIFKSLKTDATNYFLLKHVDATKFYIDDKYIYWKLKNPNISAY